MGKLILVLGGARSGKSSYAESLARQLGGEQVLFIATAQAYDDEMRERIKNHQASRAPGWHTLEEPLTVGAALQTHWAGEPVLLLDCATLWVSNLLLSLGETPDSQAAGVKVRGEVELLLAWVESREVTLIVVSNEVGMGLVPPYPLGRLYRDELGRANQMLAARAERVMLMVAGIPVDIKALARFDSLSRLT